MQSTASVTPALTARRIALMTLVVSAIALAFWLLYRYSIVPFILFVGIVLGTAIRPPVEWLHRRGLPRGAGVFVVYIALLLLVVGLVLMTAPLFTEQAASVLAGLPQFWADLRQSMMDSPSRLVRGLAWQLPAQPALGERGAPETQVNAVEQLFHVVDLLGQALFVGTSVLVLAYYWTLDGQRTIRAALLRLPAGRREGIRDIVATVETKVSAYLIGQTIVCLSVGLMSLAAYLLIGLPYAFVLAVLAAVLEAVPVVGPILGAVPAVLVALSMAPERMVWVVLAVIVIQQSESNLLVPRVMDRSVGVNPIVTILAIVAFASLFGLPGALLAIPLAAIIQVLIDRFVLSQATADLEQPVGRDRVSTLRYEVRELVNDVRKQVRRKDEEVITKDADRAEEMIETLAADLDSVLAQAAQEEARR